MMASVHHAVLCGVEVVFLVLAIAALGLDIWRTNKEFRRVEHDGNRIGR